MSTTADLPQAIRFDATTKEGTIVYVMSPTCPWCARNFDNINALSAKVVSYDFVGLSIVTEGLTDFLANNPYPFPVYALEMNTVPESFDPRATPQIIALDSDGIVQGVWVGALASGSTGLSSIEDAFDIVLPGSRTSGASIQ